MYAIVDIAGQQMKVQKNGKLFVNRLKGEEGSEVEFNKVLLIENDGKIIVGNPVIEGAVVSARIIEHLKGDKVLIFKKKRRKGYKVLKGHRQYLTQIEIQDILEAGKPKKSAAKEKAVKTEQPVSQPEGEVVTSAAAEVASAATEDAGTPAKKTRKATKAKTQEQEEKTPEATAKPRTRKAANKNEEEKAKETDE